MTRLKKLISIASESLTTTSATETSLNELPPGLSMLLQMRNGFVEFESALVVFPTTESAGVPGIHEWNNLTGWRRHYRAVITDKYICFAQDLFGLQFAIANSDVVRMNPECGSVIAYAQSIEEWAMRLLENYEEDTAWPLAHVWQMSNGVLAPNMRLLPRVPFVLGGEYVVDNLVAVECHQVMEYWGSLYEAIRDVPDGQSVRLANWIS